MSNQLQTIIKDSGLEKTKAQYILDNFTDYFTIAAEWETKAKSLVVTRPDQKDEMAQAREGRLFLREKRLAIENSRKSLKESALREGKAIDGIANVLKALIEPIEEYLDTQEHFVEIEAKKKEDAHRAEVEKRMAAEKAEQEEKDRQEKQRLAVENEKLRKEAAERDKKEAETRKKQQEKLDAERAKSREAQEKADAEKEKIEEKARADKEKAKKAAKEAQDKLDAEKARAAEEKRRLEEQLKRTVTCPKCKHKFEPEVK